MAQYTIDLPCIADTWIDASNPSATHGSDTTLKARDGSTSSEQAVIALRFDHSSLPPRKKINRLLIRIYVVDAIDNVKIRYATPAGEWDENATWNNAASKLYYGIGHSVLGTWGFTPGYHELSIDAAQYYAYDQSTRDYGFAFRWGNETSQYIVIQSREGANPPMLRVTYEDVPPSAPTPKSPIGIYKDNKSVIRFEWQYNSDVGGTQKAFDLQWSTDQTNWTTVSQTTSNMYYDMPADTLPAGNIYWRVCCYNEYDEVGPYSDIQSFYAIGTPNAPAINTIPTDTARPTVTWAAFSQQVYQLQVLSNDMIIYDSGIVPGINIRQHKIKAWLADGEYTVRIRIKNEYDLWSDWGSTPVTISTDKPEKPSIALQRSAYGVEITGTGLVYRSDYDKDDYICIGTASGTYFDNTVRSKGEYKYFIRAVSENDTFEDSDIKFIQAELRHALIAPVSDLSNVFAFTRSLNLPPKRTYNHQPGGAFVEYAGRKHPVWEPTEHVDATWQMSFYLKAWAEVEAFVALVDRKETVLYRDTRGRKVYGILSNLTINDERSGYTVGFTLTEVDYIEGVDV